MPKTKNINFKKQTKKRKYIFKNLKIWYTNTRKQKQNVKCKTQNAKNKI